MVFSRAVGKYMDFAVQGKADEWWGTQNGRRDDEAGGHQQKEHENVAEVKGLLKMNEKDERNIPVENYQ